MRNSETGSQGKKGESKRFELGHKIAQKSFIVLRCVETFNIESIIKVY